MYGNRTLGDSLRRHIRASGRSVNSIAIQSRISQPVLHKFVSGQSEVNLRTASAICQELGLDFMPKNTGELYEALFVKMVEMFRELERELRKDGADLVATRVHRYCKTYIAPALEEIRAQLGTEGEGGEGTPKAPPAGPPAAPGADAPQDTKDKKDAPKERDRKVGRPVNRLPRRVVKVDKGDAKK
jgi:hypothetical protein